MFDATRSSQFSRTGEEYLSSILESNRLPLREKRLLSSGLMAAIQPLSIDGYEVCTDSLLVELALYGTAERMLREAETMAVKKAAFGAFESSLTPIPKYCFPNRTNCETVLVHSVPRCTLNDILALCEKEYTGRYTWRGGDFYADWYRGITGRIRGAIARDSGIPGIVVRLPRLLFPRPLRIVRKERRAFAALVLRTVGRHHDRGIFHDRISEHTLFFPTPDEPVVLANYSGVLSTVLPGRIPPELLAEKAAIEHGAQCRDVYSLALLCYRIMTSERIDGTNFSLECPRPVRHVLKDISHKVRAAIDFSTPRMALRSCAMSGAIAVSTFAKLRRVLSCRESGAWSRINRATGGLWRTVPFLGVLGDLFFPTGIARALRCVLDRTWFMEGVHSGFPAGGSPSRFADITILTSAFKVRGQVKCSCFENAWYSVTGDSVVRRRAFGSVMEGRGVHSPGKGRRTRRGAGRAAIIAAVAAVALFIVSLGMNLRTRAGEAGNGSRRSADMMIVTSGAPERKIPAKSSAVPPETFLHQNTEDSGSDSGSTGPVSRSGLREAADKRFTQRALPRVNPHTGSIHARDTAVHRRTDDTTAGPGHSMEGGESVESGTDAGKPGATAVEREDSGRDHGIALSPVKGYRGVFIVTGVADSCNPGMLYRSGDVKRDSAVRSFLAVADRRLFVAHRFPDGFGPPVTLRLCRSGECDSMMYYEAEGINGIGRAAYVRSGDALSPHRIRLRSFTGRGNSLSR